VLKALEPGDPGSEWYAFSTRPRCEKKAVSQFSDMGLAHYLPLRKKVSERKGRRPHSSEIPLFPGYLFGRCDVGERLRAMRGGHLSRWLEAADQSTFLKELRNICLASMCGTGVELYPQMRRGTKVRVTTGALAGVDGRISCRKGNFRIVLELTLLQSAVAVEVDMQDVQVLETA
jgi:hypothetical protein